MKKITYILLFLTISINAFSQNNYQTKPGWFDFSDISDKSYPLTGKWEFYWDTLLIPGSEKFKNPKDFIKVNSVWNNHKINGQKLPGDGVATYHLKIIVPSKGDYAIKFHQILSAYKVFINGKEICEVGKVSKNKSQYKGVVRTNIVNFHTDKDTIDLVVQVANYSHLFGGIQEPVYFGRSNVIAAQTTEKILFLFLKTGAEIIFALYFFFSFFFRQKDLSYIFFSLAIFITVIFDLVNNEMAILQFIPNMPFEIEKKIDFFSNYFRLTLFTLFLWYSFKEYKIFNKLTFYLISLISGVLSILILVTPCKVYSTTLIPFEVISLLSFLYFLGMTFYGVLKKIPFIGYTFAGMLILNIGTVNDILTNINVINTPFILNYTLLIFFISHSITLSLKYSSSIQQVSILSKHFIKYEKILSDVINFYSYDLEKIIDSLRSNLNLDEIKLLAVTDEKTVCECTLNNNHTLCSKNKEKLQVNLNENLLNKITKLYNSKIIEIDDKNILVFPVEKNDDTKYIFLFIKEKNISKAITDVIEMLSPQLSTFIDNYKYYYELQNINANLEQIIEERSRLILAQKKELEDKNEELTEKIEELNISAKLIEELNKELEEKRNILKKQNELLEEAKKTILEQKKILEENENYIKQSIEYAKKIQEVLYSDKFKLPFKSSFLCSTPRDMISGDLIANKKIGNTWYFGIIDTTAINVSAVFVGFLVHGLLDDILIHENMNPAEIIKSLRYEFIRYFGANTEDIRLNVQFDISLATLNLTTGNLLFSSTKFPAVIVRNREAITLYGDNFPIGNYLENTAFNFSTTSFTLKHNDSVYLFSDGFYNQLNTNGRKYTQKKFFDFLAEISFLPPDKQKEKLQKEFEAWKGNFKRIDDFAIIGYKFTPEN